MKWWSCSALPGEEIRSGAAGATRAESQFDRRAAAEEAYFVLNVAFECYSAVRRTIVIARQRARKAAAASAKVRGKKAKKVQ
jgi:hypothetical protein